MLGVLQQFFSNTGKNEELQLKVLTCFQAWIFLLRDMGNSLILNSKLAQFAFDALKSKALFTAAADCVSMV